MNNRRQPSSRPALRRTWPAVDSVECPRCGRLTAKVIGRSESLPIVYLRCSGCQQTSVAGA